MTVTIETNSRGEVVLRAPNPRGQMGVIEARQIFMQLTTGHCFVAPSTGHRLSQLSSWECDMIQHWLREKGLTEPVIFAGHPPKA